MGVLHLAAQGDKLSSFLFLHNKKLDLNNCDLKLSTPLHWAAFSGSQKIVEYLLAQKGIQLNPVDVEGFTPLHLATTYGNSKIVKKLLIAGADRSNITNKGQTALQIAEEKEFHGI